MDRESMFALIGLLYDPKFKAKGDNLKVPSQKIFKMVRLELLVTLWRCGKQLDLGINIKNPVKPTSTRILDSEKS